MSWGIEFLEEAKKDMQKLDHSVRVQVLKGIRDVERSGLFWKEKPFYNLVLNYSLERQECGTIILRNESKQLYSGVDLSKGEIR